MNEILERLIRFLESTPGNDARLRDTLSGRVSYGMLCDNSGVVVQVNEDGSKTYGSFAGSGAFIPFTPDEFRDFKKKRGGRPLPFSKLSLK